MKTSAYMIAHCDDDFLAEAIGSVIDRVDELIFVDGAYRWVAPYFERCGLDPERSGQKTHDILATFGEKVRYFSGLWDDELHKRAFGYDQCQGDIIIRIDADEIFEFDESAWSQFLTSDKGVAEMVFPYLLTPHSERLKSELEVTPNQCAVFKASHFRTPEDHCGYLWLVLTPEERARCREANWSYLFPGPVIRTAHLTALRTPRVSVNRARFYTLQHMRTTGHTPWRMPPSEKPPYERLLDFMSAEAYASFLEGHEIVSGFAHMHDFRVAPVTFGDAVTAKISAAAHAHARALEDLLDFAAHPRTVVSGMATQINITSLIARGCRRIELTFESPPEGANGHLYFLLGVEGDQNGRNLGAAHLHLDGPKATYYLDEPPSDPILQACLVVNATLPKGQSLTRIVGLSAVY